MRKTRIAAFLLVALVVSSSASAMAAPKVMPDGQLFDAEYYASANPDVAAVFGSDEALLYQHYTQCGKAEGRLGVAVEPGAKTDTPSFTNLLETDAILLMAKTQMSALTKAAKLYTCESFDINGTEMSRVMCDWTPILGKDSTVVMYHSWEDWAKKKNGTSLPAQNIVGISTRNCRNFYDVYAQFINCQGFQFDAANTTMEVAADNDYYTSYRYTMQNVKTPLLQNRMAVNGITNPSDWSEYLGVVYDKKLKRYEITNCSIQINYRDASGVCRSNFFTLGRR